MMLHQPNDGVTRCQWPGIADGVYAAYHDTEWGVPQADERALFEKLILEGFQSGLSWLTILRKRAAFRSAFDGFDAEKMARYDAGDVVRLMANPGIVRNRLKIEGAVSSARAYLALREQTTLGDFVWGFAESAGGCFYQAHGEVPSQTVASQQVAKGLKARGFRFVGPTTAYAFMQSVGIVNDHLAGCHRRGPCEAARQTFLRERANLAVGIAETRVRQT